MSGATLLRSGFQALMREALRNEFDIVLAEALDRFSRNQEDTAGLFKRLTFAGVNIVTLAEGDITRLHIGLKGTMNRIVPEGAGRKDAPRMRGGVELGKAGSSLCLGYRVVRQLQRHDNHGKRARLTPKRRPSFDYRFESYTAGASPKQIAKTLNGEGVRGPRSVGTRAPDPRQPEARRRMLNNELYMGAWFGTDSVL